jgi:hypothetical protein
MAVGWSELLGSCTPILNRRSAFQKTYYRDIFVDGWPVNSFAFTEHFKRGKLLGRGTSKARKPSQWDRQNSPIVE